MEMAERVLEVEEMNNKVEMKFWFFYCFHFAPYLMSEKDSIS